MEKIFNQMKEYLSMDSEISYEEFFSYYEEVMEYLKNNLDGLNEEEVHQGRFVLLNISSNAEERAKRKGPLAKKYKKLREKTRLWEDAMTYRLTQMGLTNEQIDECYLKLYDSV
ncbi:MAG: hypothetical protein ACYDG6_04385 [Thermincolia bacterium]